MGHFMCWASFNATERTIIPYQHLLHTCAECGKFSFYFKMTMAMTNAFLLERVTFLK